MSVQCFTMTLYQDTLDLLSVMVYLYACMCVLVLTGYMRVLVHVCNGTYFVCPLSLSLVFTPGLSNPEEFSFITEEETSEMTLRRVCTSTCTSLPPFFTSSHVVEAYCFFNMKVCSLASWSTLLSTCSTVCGACLLKIFYPLFELLADCCTRTANVMANERTNGLLQHPMLPSQALHSSKRIIVSS